MSKLNRSVASVVGVGLALHKLHDAADGFQWALSICPVCHLRRRLPN